VSQILLFPDPQPLVERLGKTFFRKIPRQPGVYKMRDAADNIVYVGKARNLRQRLRGYRIASPERMPRRHLRMLREVVRIDFELCPGETAALKQEAKLIRTLKPRFNRAGVWPGRPRFLTWRFEPPIIEIAVQETPAAGWGRLGPLGSGARRLCGALVRLLWLSLNPDSGYAGLPRGWAGGEMGDPARLPCGHRFEELRTALETGFCRQPETFVLWVASALPAGVSAFEHAALRADCEIIQKLAVQQNRKNTEPDQLPLL
jgi:hypothetical protein